MKFLVILVALLINHYWTRDRALPGDGWFERLQGSLHGLAQRFEQYDMQRWLAVLVLLLPSCILLGLLWFVEGVWFGLISFCAHVALLLMLFDPVHLRTWTQRYLAHWREEDFEGAYLCLQARYPRLRLENSDDKEAVHAQCSRFLLTTSFERLFAVLFWYLVLGPGGALAYFVLLQMRRVRYRDGSLDYELPWLTRLQFVLEWVPARLLGLTFALAGHFEATFNCLRGYVVDLSSTAMGVVEACANAAIGRAQNAPLIHDSEDGGSVNSLVIDIEREGEPLTTLQYVQQIEDVLNLLDRSQIIWVSALALLAVYGIGA